MKHSELIMNYILNNRDNLALEVQQMQQNLRHRNIDPVDCLEFMLAKERLSFFDKISKELIALMNITDTEIKELYKYVEIDKKLILECKKNNNKRG